jgi:S-adenosylmethionine:tRNA ribosyltransferase-isomerase
MNAPTTFRRSDFDFPIPDALIAHEPLSDREDARLAVWRPHESLEHARIRDLERLIPENALIIVNNSRVIPSRVLANLPTGGRMELLLLEPDTDAPERPGICRWKALGRPLRKLKPGTKVELAEGVTATIEARLPQSGDNPDLVRVCFSRDGEDFLTWLSGHGYIPLPPYIDRPDPLPAARSSDTSWYQTVYAQTSGSVAAPTAGLHFTDRLMKALGSRGVSFAEVTLHVGAGTFLPVKSEDINAHAMHEERFLVPRATLSQITAARGEGRPIIAVGTTSLRALESFYRACEGDEARLPTLAGSWMRTRLFLRPRDSEDRVRPWAISALMTNFHQPSSTLLMLVSALIGYEATRGLYEAAVAEKYRFFSYGDACLLWLNS